MMMTATTVIATGNATNWNGTGGENQDFTTGRVGRCVCGHGFRSDLCPEELVRSPQSSGAKVLAAPPPSFVCLQAAFLPSIKVTAQNQGWNPSKGEYSTCEGASVHIASLARSLLPLRFYIRVVKWLMRRGGRVNHYDVVLAFHSVLHSLPTCPYRL